MPYRIEIRQAEREEHETILRIARQSKYTKDFGNHIFSGEEHYRKGWIRVALIRGEIVGFSCFRLKTRQPETKLYFLKVREGYERHGIGRRLMVDLEALSDNEVALDCCKDNPACGFYRGLGYAENGDALDGTAIRFVKKKTPVG